MSQRPYVDILIVIPLEEELLEFQDAFGIVDGECCDSSIEHHFTVEDSGLHCVAILQDEMGKSSALHSAQRFLANRDVGLLICLGIAGGLSSDLDLGDVFYTGNIIDVYDNNKASELSAGGMDIEFSPTIYQTPRDLTNALNMVRVHPTLKKRYADWQNNQGKALQALAKETGAEISAIELTTRPKARNGSVACGVVSKSTTYNAKLKAIDRKILGIDTESGGVFHVASAREIPAVTIRGVSDKADGDKTSLERRTKGVFRTMAAQNAATFLKLQFSNPHFVNFVQSLRDGGQFTQVGNAVPDQGRSDDIANIVSLIGKQIDSRLRELCPEIKLQPKGYHLPTPRLRQVDFISGLDEPMESDPIDLWEALRDRQTILLSVPRTYPDQSIAWVIANDLLTAVVEDTQVLPVVIDGDAIKPPSNTLAHLASREGFDVNHQHQGRLVFIIDNLPLKSKTRLAFVIEQIRAFPNCKFIFLCRADANLVQESEFLDAVAADTFTLCKISFEEIADFLEKNFSMTVSEASVVALRLHDTFDQFDLSAHPTYFAGIPRETLAALLQANRRSELIQLAVDGFLSFVVADDPSDINLSRTTRSRFLQKLAVSINVEKLNYDQAELINFTKSFAREFDFNIDPLAFINSFVQKGILHFEDDRIAFSLPFIEKYLLALALLGEKAKALTYFDFDDPNFDFGTFDIYAEIGAASDLVNRLRTRIRESMDQLRPINSEKHVLLTDSILPTLMGRPDRLRSFQSKLKEAIQSVQSNKEDRKEKQRFLDISERVRRQTAKRTKATAETLEKKVDVRVENLKSAVQIWHLGTVMLGSGAEHLNAETKQELARELIEFSATIMHAWSKLRSETDFEEIKKELTKDTFVQEVYAANENGQSLEKTRALIASLVDILEYGFLCEPFRRIVHHLCENARHRVLAMSLEKAQGSSLMERIVHGVWLADVDTPRGIGALKSTIKSLPPYPFLRLNLANHLITRVYWSQWRTEDRSALLDLAHETIQPIQVSRGARSSKLTIDKGQFAKMIASNGQRKKTGKRRKKQKGKR